MNTGWLESDRLAALIDRFASCRIAVCGDYFLDKYLEVDPELQESSLETGKPAHQIVGIRCSPGAAGTVVSNLASLGTGHLHAIGVVGDDGEAYDLRQALRRLGCSDEHLFTANGRFTPTYLKPRDRNIRGLAGEHSRYDTKNRRPTPEAIQRRLIASLEAVSQTVDALVVMDQVEEAECGVVTRAVREGLTRQARAMPEVIFWADSRRRIRNFRGVVIKPNQFEAVGMVDPPPDAEVAFATLCDAAQQMRHDNDAPIVVTRGAKGMLVSDPDWTIVPGVSLGGEVDTTGAGDSATAGTVLALAAGATLPEAAVVGNLVASITVQQLATTGVARPDQLPERLAQWQQQAGRAS